MFKQVETIIDRSNAGECLNDVTAMQILNAEGAELTLFMAGAQAIKEQHFEKKFNLCSIINAKSGRCAENCSFCAQSVHHHTDSPIYPLKSLEEIVSGAKQAERCGSHCYGIVTSGTTVEPGVEFDRILEAIRQIRRETSVEPSASLGILDTAAAQALADAGCRTYHHNLETARSFFPQVCTTHDYEDDVATIRRAKAAGMQVCSGGIFGLGESLEQRLEMGLTLRDLDVDSIPLNFLNPVAGTHLAGAEHLTPLDCLRVICLYRYLMPSKRITICGGRDKNLREFQSAIFMAGASGMMIGNYLTTSGRNLESDMQLLKDAEVETNVY